MSRTGSLPHPARQAQRFGTEVQPIAARGGQIGLERHLALLRAHVEDNALTHAPRRVRHGQYQLGEQGVEHAWQVVDHRTRRKAPPSQRAELGFYSCDSVFMAAETRFRLSI